MLAHLPDSAFPVIHGDPPPRKRRDGSIAPNWADYVLAECLLTANRLLLRCAVCDHTVSIDCETIARNHSRWLHLPIRTWARGLRCRTCSSKRILVAELADTASNAAFRHSTYDTAQLIQARRLEWFMTIAGRPIEDVAGLVSAYRPSKSFRV